MAKWTDPEILLLRKHYAPSLSSTEIAAAMSGGLTPGCRRVFTANAVRGKLDDIGLKTAQEGTWTDERVDELRKLAKDLTMAASDIARRMNHGMGRGEWISRNAVIGKLHRLGLANETSKAVRSRGPKKMAAIARTRMVRMTPRDPPPKFGAEPLPCAREFDVGRIPFAKTTSEHCLWIPGDPLIDDRVCGLQRIAGRPYCEHHMIRATAQGVEVRSKARNSDGKVADDNKAECVG